MSVGNAGHITTNPPAAAGIPPCMPWRRGRVPRARRGIAIAGRVHGSLAVPGGGAIGVHTGKHASGVRHNAGPHAQGVRQICRYQDHCKPGLFTHGRKQSASWPMAGIDWVCDVSASRLNGQQVMTG